MDLGRIVAKKRPREKSPKLSMLFGSFNDLQIEVAG